MPWWAVGVVGVSGRCCWVIDRWGLKPSRWQTFLYVGLVYRGVPEVSSEDELEDTIDETEARSMHWMTRRHATTALVNAAGFL